MRSKFKSQRDREREEEIYTPSVGGHWLCSDFQPPSSSPPPRTLSFSFRLLAILWLTAAPSCSLIPVAAVYYRRAISARHSISRLLAKYRTSSRVAEGCLGNVVSWSLVRPTHYRLTKGFPHESPTKGQEIICDETLKEECGPKILESTPAG